MNQQRSIYYSCSQEYNATFDVYELFQYYNIHFFSNQLEKCTVRWTSRMTLCAGTCKYQGFGSSTISLSQPLLKFRTPNQVKQTLLHEMIHAYLFKTNPAACKFDGGHGPAFIQIMNRINSITGLNISIRHSFHDQVDFYRQHIWRCNGRCKDNPPFYGYVKRSMNRPPQPADHWFAQHRRLCGGQFTKISQPQKTKKQKNKQKRTKKISNEKDRGSTSKGKTIQDYVNEMNKQAGKKQKQKKVQNNGSEIEVLNKEKRKSNESKQKSNKSESLSKLGKGKTIQQYWTEIQNQKNNIRQQKTQKQQEKKDTNLDLLLKRYENP